MARPYLRLRNYTSNLRTLGFTDADIADASDRLVDALVAHGDPATVAARLTEHLDAGADHVCAQILTRPDEDPVHAAACAGRGPAARLSGALTLRSEHRR